MSLRVATYNIHFGGVGRTGSIVDSLKTLDANIILLVEASADAVTRTVADELGMQFVTAKGRKAQLALLTHLPILSQDSLFSQQLGRPLLKAQMSVGDHTTIAVCGMHLQCHYLYRNERQRVNELTTYLDHIDRQRLGPHFLLGDFNAIAPGDRLEKNGLPIKERLMLRWERGQVYHEAIGYILERGYTDCYRQAHPSEPGFTLPVHAPHVRLDYIFADPVMARQLKTCDVISCPASLQASDHLPVLAEFDL